MKEQRRINKQQKIQDELDQIKREKEAQKIKEWEQKFDEEQKLREQEELLKEAKLKRREEQKQNRVFPIESEHANLKKQSSDEDFQSRLETFEAKQSKEN